MKNARICCHSIWNEIEKKMKKRQQKKQFKFYTFSLAPSTSLGTKEILNILIFINYVEINYHYFVKVYYSVMMKIHYFVLNKHAQLGKCMHNLWIANNERKHIYKYWANSIIQESNITKVRNMKSPMTSEHQNIYLVNIWHDISYLKVLTLID